MYTEMSKDNFCTRTLTTTLKWSILRVRMEKKLMDLCERDIFFFFWRNCERDSLPFIITESCAHGRTTRILIIKYQLYLQPDHYYITCKKKWKRGWWHTPTNTYA